MHTRVVRYEPDINAELTGSRRAEPAFDLNSVVGPIRRRARLIAAATLSTFLLAALVLFALTPRYTASTLLLVEPTNKNLLEPGPSFAVQGSENARIESEVGILRSPSILLKVIEENGLVDDPEFGGRVGLRRRLMELLRLEQGGQMSPQAVLQQSLENLSRRVTVERQGSTFLIRVSVESESPEKAAKLAGSIAQTYIRAQVEAKIDGTLAARDVLEKRISLSSQNIERSETAFQSFLDRYLITISENDATGSLADLRDRLAAARRARDVQQRLFRGIEDHVARKEWATLAERLNSEAISDLSSDYSRISDELLKAAAGGTPARASLRDELARVEAELRTRSIDAAAGLRDQLDAQNSEVAALQQQVREAVLQSDLPTETLTNLYQLQQESEIARSQYQTLLARLREVEAQSDLQLADSRIVSAAMEPTRPSFPKTTLILALALCGGGALGLSLAYVYENHIGGFISEDQVASVLGVPRVYPLPLQRGSEGGNGDAPLADMVVDAPFSQFTESIRRIWTALEQLRVQETSNSEDKGSPALVVMVSSASPGEGKTTVAASLARVFAIEGRRTLLMDCDLRRPSAHRQIGIEPKLGVQDILMSVDEGSKSTGIVVSDPRTNLHVIASNRNSPQPKTTLTAGDRFKKLLNLVSKRYDVIVIDTPPLGPVVDGLHIARFVDALVFVTRFAETPQRDALAALDAVNMAREHPLDVICVLNKRQGDGLRRSTYGGYYDA